MHPDQQPLPLETLPPGWGLAAHEGAHIAYRYSRLPIELVAARTDGERVHPAVGLERPWELRCRHLAGEFPFRDVIGCVSTRRAALLALRESMQRLHDETDTLESPFDVRRVLERISLCDRVPEPSDTP
ncbi:hypothetical protein [Natronobiforma cellulositropha]|uniref:hypothetical protein n=1 Tax=Natronobiforma cellulositropha TaxID=1679076 RepID=UPI0021D5F1D6|nr:hypothetical protein [Natronobiforma cellulositropha]